eukprot:SAG31_NODE_38668_length_294_cov_1.051282_1_plen_29_part_10
MAEAQQQQQAPAAVVGVASGGVEPEVARP